MQAVTNTIENANAANDPAQVPIGSAEAATAPAQKAIGSWSDTLQESLVASLTNIWEGAIALIPNLIVGALIMVVGYIVSAVLRWIATLILRRVRFDTLCEKTGLTEMSQTVGLSSAPSRMFGRLIFYGAMLMFFTIAVDVLGLDNLSQAVHSFITYLPNAIAALVILVFGLILANFVRGAVQGAAERVGLEYGSALGGVVFAAVLIVIATMVVSQLQIDTALVNRAIEIFLLAAGAAVAIALGFGTRDTARHIVAGVYVRESLKPGATITVGDLHGELLAVEKVNTKLKGKDGNIIVIPNAQLIEKQIQHTA